MKIRRSASYASVLCVLFTALLPVTAVGQGSAKDSKSLQAVVKPAGAAPVGTEKSSTQPARAADSSPPGDPSAALAGAKSDVLQQTQESPATTLGDAFKMMLYLVPVLVLIVLAVRGLKALQQRTGALPGMRQGLLGGFNLTNARKSGSGSIRILESVPIGTIGLHLVEVRGRTLLLGASATSVTKLLEFDEAAPGRDPDFEAMLAAVSHDLEADPDAVDGGLGTMVGALDDTLRETREAIARSAARAQRSAGKRDDDDTISGPGRGR